MLAIYFKGRQQFFEIACATGLSALVVVLATLAKLANAADRRQWFGA